MITLANKYRPQTFDDVSGQDVTITVLKHQIEQDAYSHTILFAGYAGCGKTTCAKIFANSIDGEIYELDCASHNGVEEIRKIVDDSRTQSLIHKYKVYILDECHTLSAQAWSSLLIVLEENLPKTIFIFCTTDTQKIPNTIMSRVQRFNFLPITNKVIYDRLKYVCEKENITIEDEALKTLSKSSNSSMRQALTNLDKCLMYGELTDSNIRKVLNIVSDDIMSDLYDVIIGKDNAKIIKYVLDIYNNGYELHLFMRKFLDYCLANQKDLRIIDTCLTILQDIKYDDNPKNIIIARFLTWK